MHCHQRREALFFALVQMFLLALFGRRIIAKVIHQIILVSGALVERHIGGDGLVADETLPAYHSLTYYELQITRQLAPRAGKNMNGGRTIVISRKNSTMPK